jgi:hypothetical protein
VVGRFYAYGMRAQVTPPEFPRIGKERVARGAAAVETSSCQLPLRRQHHAPYRAPIGEDLVRFGRAFEG